MAKTVQIRNVPDHVHKTVRARADRAGVSVSDYLRALITELAQHPTIVEIMEGRGTLAATNGARRDDARPDGARPDSARPDSARPDSARPDSARPEGARPAGTRTPVPRRS